MSTAVLPAPTAAVTTSQLLAENWLRNVFPSDLFTVRGREAIAAVETDADPMPTIAVVRVHPKDDAERTPVLVVEVADAAVAYDLGAKSSLYAAAGVRDYWVIDVIARRLHVFRDPQPDPAAPHGHAYRRTGVLQPSALIAPLAAEIHLAQVVDLLPRS